jgi:TPR repeat protein
MLGPAFALCLALLLTAGSGPLAAQGDGGVTPDFVKKLDKQSKDGDDAATHTLGMIYFYGEGVKQDYRKSAEYLGRSADAGFVPSQSFLGYLYENGFGVKEDVGKAVGLYTKAAEAGDTLAQLSLGALYFHGKKAPEDPSKAFSWLSKAAGSGDYQALLLLSQLYAEGKGTPADAKKSLDMLTKAADNPEDDGSAAYLVGEVYRTGNLRAGSLTITPDVKTARTFYQKGAATGHAASQEKLAQLDASKS